MKTDFNNKEWGVADFERYYSGKMPEREMHALEKAALDDPFLQDALDGYGFSTTPQADILTIKERLWPSADKTPVIAIPWYRTKTASQLFKAAAAVILFGGLGWLYMSRNNTPGKEDTELASNEVKTDKKAPADTNQSSLYNLDDSVPVIAQLDKEIPESNIAEGREDEAPSPSKSAENKTVAEVEELARNDERVKDKSAYKPVISENKKASPAKEITDIAPAPNRSSQISGRVVNQQGKPVPNAVVRNNADSRQAVSSDQNGNFIMNNANTTGNSNAVPVEVNAEGYERSNQNITNNSTNNTIVLNEADNKSDYYTIENSDKLKNRKEKYQWNGRNSRIQLRNAKPLEGWDYFYYVMNDSISNNKSLMQHKGRMILSFDVNDDGKVKQVAVKKSLNLVADSIASEIILKSPVLELINDQKKGEAIIKMQ